MAKILVIFNQKGGPGKTTIVMSLAGYLIKQGKKVVVVDSDPQASSHKWETRPIEQFPQHPASVRPIVGVTVGQYAANIEKLINEGYDFILIDTPPRLDSADLAAALFVADRGLIPFVPDIMHKDALEEVQELLNEVNEKRVRKGFEALPVGLVVNMMKPGRAAQKHLAERASDMSGFPVLATLGDLAPFESASNFRTTIEAVSKPSDKARKELAALARAVEEFMK
jgi:chromosome partitioning protein